MYCPKCGAANADQASFCAKCGANLKGDDQQAKPSATAIPVYIVTVYAGFWKRLAAFIIDYLIIGAATFALIFVSMGFLYPAAIVAGWLYFALMESSEKQATLGKMALGIIVTDMEGERISFGRATGRYFGKILSAIILYIGHIMIAFTEKKQGLHDMLANTLVVNK
jgi:uncharacterized RDD family membrane protein YckC